MIGGSGEKKTLRMVAQYADESNLSSGGIDEIPRKLDALASALRAAGPRPLPDQGHQTPDGPSLRPPWKRRRPTWPKWPRPKDGRSRVVEMAKGILIFGDPDTVGEQLQACMDTGIDGMTINLPGNGHKTERIGLLGEVATAALG